MIDFKNPRAGDAHLPASAEFRYEVGGDVDDGEAAGLARVEVIATA